MHRLRSLIARMRALVRSKDLDADFAQELDSHLAMLIDDYVRGGMRRDEAEQTARRRLGMASSLAARHRDARGLPAADDLWQDLRFALRLSWKERAFTLAAIAALAIGIGANAFGFSVIYAAFVRGLPFPDAHQLVRVGWRSGANSIGSLSHAEFVEWRDTARSVELAAILETAVNISGEGAGAQQVRGAWMSADGFRILQQPVLLGRDFAADEDHPGAAPVVIIGHRLWRERFDADVAILGRTLRLNGQAATIVGVMPEGMRFYDNADLWAPLTVDLAKREDLDSLIFEVFGRLRRGVTPDGAEAELTSIAQRSAVRPADSGSATRTARVYQITAGGVARTIFRTVMVVGGLVLLIACANVANLLLSRTPYRAREIALRIALGATRTRVVRQLLLESVVLAVLGGALGLLLAAVATTAFEAAVQGSGKPYWLVFTTEPALVLYVAALCLVTTVAFGVVPALHVSRSSAHEMLKDGGRTTTDGGRVRVFSGTLVVIQIAFTVALLGGAGLVIRGFLALYGMDIGIRTDRLAVIQLDLLDRKYPDAPARWDLFSRLVDRIDAVPGVEAVALVDAVPPFDGGERPLCVEHAADRPPRFVSTVMISPEFFTTVERPVLRGRAFDARDGAPGVETVIVNQDLAEAFFPGEEAIGRRIRFTQRDAAPERDRDPWRTIVGVSASIRHGSSEDGYRSAVVYLPYRAEAPADARLLVRSGTPLPALVDAVRRQLAAEDGDLPIVTAAMLDQMIANDRWAHRVFGGLFAILAAASLILSGVGLYAVMAHGVSRRRHEIGVRMAVGAGRARISWMIVKRGLVQLAIGLPIGLIGVVMLGAVLEALLVDMTPADPLTLVAIVSVLSAVSLTACLIPATRAMRVDPVEALRAD